jgi:lysophospholipase L1-like esterase
MSAAKKIRGALVSLGTSIGVTVGLVVVLEIFLGIFMPQTPSMTSVTGDPFAVPDSVLGHRYAPYAHVDHRTSEFHVEYRTNAFGRRDRTDLPGQARSSVDGEEPSGEHEERAGGNADRSHDGSGKADAGNGPTGAERAGNGQTGAERAGAARTGAEAALRILVLGDSFTFGDGNHYDDIWPVVMEQHLSAGERPIEVINAGVEGYDTRTQLLYLERIYEEVRPDIVLLAFMANDVFTNAPLSTEPGETAIAVKQRGAGIMPRHTIALGKRIAASNDRLYTRIYLITARREFFTLPMSATLQKQMATTAELFSAIDAYCRARGTTLVVLSMPQQFQVIVKANHYEPAGIDVDFIDGELARLADGDGFHWFATLDMLADAYRDNGHALYYRVDGHLNAEGNRVVGEYAATVLRPVVAAVRAAD